MSDDVVLRCVALTANVCKRTTLIHRSDSDHSLNEVRVPCALYDNRTIHEVMHVCAHTVIFCECAGALRSRLRTLARGAQVLKRPIIDAMNTQQSVLVLRSHRVAQMPFKQTRESDETVVSMHVRRISVQVHPRFAEKLCSR